MISVTELRTGRTFKSQGRLYQVVEYRHTKIARGTANIRVKVRDLRTGDVAEKTFISGAKVEPVGTETRSLQYLYRDEINCYFMDPRSFEQFSLPVKIFKDKTKFLKEGGKVRILFGEGEPLSFELPTSMTLKVDRTAPGVKGDTVSGGTKPATLENNFVVQVPLFIKPGDRIKINTRTGEYLERVRSRS